MRTISPCSSEAMSSPSFATTNPPVYCITTLGGESWATVEAIISSGVLLNLVIRSLWPI